MPPREDPDVSDPAIFQITDGEFALAVVDKAAAGYSDAWQAPGGKTAATATVADFGAEAAAFVCQITSGKLTPSKNTNRTDRAATFCSPASSTPTPGETTYALDVSYFLDEHVRAGLAAFLYENDTLDGYFLLGLNDGGAPRAVGRVVLTAGDFGGDPQANRTGSVSLDVKRKPDVLFGAGTVTRLITGTGTVTDSGA